MANMKTRNTNNNNIHLVSREMKPGKVYKVNPAKKPMTRNKKRKMYQHLLVSRMINIILVIAIIATIIFSQIEITKLNKKITEVTDAYNMLLQENNFADNTSFEESPSATTKLVAEHAIKPETTQKSDPELSLDDIILMQYKNVPLDDDLKVYMYKSAIAADINPEILFAMAWKESEYDSSAISATNDHGLFQINICNFERLSDVFDRSMNNFKKDIYDPYFNTDCAIYILSECRDNYNNSNWHHVLMRYNMGPSGAQNAFNSGSYSSAYSREVIEYAMNNFGLTDIEIR